MLRDSGAVPGYAASAQGRTGSVQCFQRSGCHCRCLFCLAWAVAYPAASELCISPDAFRGCFLSAKYSASGDDHRAYGKQAAPKNLAGLLFLVSTVLSCRRRVGCVVWLDYKNGGMAANVTRASGNVCDLSFVSPLHGQAGK